MKKTLLFACLFSLAMPARAQLLPTPAGAHEVANHADDTILLVLPDEGEAAWRRAAQVLVAHGYTLAYSDGQLLALTTNFTNLEDAGTYLSLFVLVQGHQLTLRARSCVSPTPDKTLSAVTPKALFGTSRDWQLLEAVARDLGGTKYYLDSPAW